MVVHDDELDKGLINIIETNRKWMEQRQKELSEKEAARDRLDKECESIRHELALMAAWLDSVSGRDKSETENVPVGTGKDKQVEEGRQFTQKIVPRIQFKKDSVPATDFASNSDSQARDNTPEGKGDMELRGDRLRNEVAAILQEVYPGALYYRDILQCLQKKGYKVSGKDPGLNLIAHLTHDDRFERGEKRGVYVLSASYANK